MSPVRALSAIVLLLAAGPGRAATPKEVDAALQKGVAYLKRTALDGADKEAHDRDRVGTVALAGLALLEAGVPPDDPVVRKITARVRDAAFTETRTYQITLCLLYLDRLGESSDIPLIQMLGVRLVAGQNAGGGWTYECIPAVAPADERTLRTRLTEATLTAGTPPDGTGKPPAKAGGPLAAGKLHADVEKYRQALMTATGGNRNRKDDNSNTQFGILGVWVARKHGLPVEEALDRIEKRYLGSQTASGGWPYPGPGPGAAGSPSMTCAGLLGLAVGVARREERLLRANPGAVKPVPPKKGAGAEPPDPFAPKPGAEPTDPFAPKNAPPPAKKPDRPAPKANRPPDAIDLAIKKGMDNLAEALAGHVVTGKGKGKGTNHDFYFLWSLERVGVVYGVEKIGRFDWYQWGADYLVSAQRGDGSWTGKYGPTVDTAFAVLFLSRSNVVRDLSAKVQQSASTTELRAGPGTPPGPPAVAPMPTPKPDPMTPAVVTPMPKPAPTARDIASDLLRARDADWNAALERVRDAKGTEYTTALVAVIPLLDDARKKAARDALAERLCRMTAPTLRGMLKSDDAELRRAAALACAMKDDKGHVPDLIAALDDKSDAVAKAARAGLKALTGKDFATAAEWRAWYAEQKK